MVKTCDNTSVGVVIRDAEGRFALLRRAKFPVGIAPAAGHIDDHGSPEQAALDEVEEELGIKLSSLEPTVIHARRVDNRCRRVGGDHHIWYIYEAIVNKVELKPSADETKGADWYSADRLQSLAHRTKNYWAGKVSEGDWTNEPGLEEVWVQFMEELGYLKGAA